MYFSYSYFLPEVAMKEWLFSFFKILMIYFTYLKGRTERARERKREGEPPEKTPNH